MLVRRGRGGVIPASKARRESNVLDSGQAGMTNTTRPVIACISTSQVMI